MPDSKAPLSETLPRDLTAGLVVFLVALPLCLGVALASNAPLFSGVLTGIVGGLLVGFLSGSHSSVSGPAAGLTAVVAAQLASLGSFNAFLTALVIAGGIQIVLGVARAGFIAAFFPSSVIKGLLAAIGVILILKQIPHVLGHDADPMGDKSFSQPDGENTFTELGLTFFDMHVGAAIVGLLSIGIIVAWDKVQALKKSPLPSALVVVIVGVAVNAILGLFGQQWVINPTHLVQVPVASHPLEIVNFFQYPDWSAAFSNPKIYTAAFTIAIVASLETLLNLEAVDKLDPRRRTSPPNRELVAQGIGNVVSGLIGGLPMTSVIVRSSVNINAGARTKASAIFHGVLLVGCVAIIPGVLNLIPLSSLAAILLMTGLKLASPKLFKQMWSEGRYQFAPFIITVVAIVLTDLLVGIIIGLAISIAFILHSNFRRPLHRIMEKHASGDVLHIELGNQVSFLNRAILSQTLATVPRGGHVLIDASSTDYIDQDIMDLINDFTSDVANAHGVEVSLVGFKNHYQIEDRIQFVDYSSREVQMSLTPTEVLEVMKAGNQRFLNGRPLRRNFGRLIHATAPAQYPMAVVLSCIDSRVPAEAIFDLSLGDVFSARIAGNIATGKILGSMEYACAVAGAKLILIMGHTSCGAVNAAVDFYANKKKASEVTGCGNLDIVVDEIQEAIDLGTIGTYGRLQGLEKSAYSNDVAKRNVIRTKDVICERSSCISKLVREGKVAIVGALYDVKTGTVTFFEGVNLPPEALEPLPQPVEEMASI